MKYFKDENNKVYAFETDGSQDAFIPEGLVAITEAEADAIRFPAKSFSELQADKSQSLNTECQNAIYAGYTSNALGSEHHYPAKDKDQTNMVASVTDSYNPDNATDWTTSFWCADIVGNWNYRPHTAQQIRTAGSDGKAAITAALTKNATLQYQVSIATTEAELDAIAWD